MTDNADDEYMHLFALKTLQFVRAPDGKLQLSTIRAICARGLLTVRVENVFIAPFNLIELFGLIIPFEWWMPKHSYERLNNYVMGFIYSPMLLVIAWLEVRTAHQVIKNRERGDSDDDQIEEWEQLFEDGALDLESEGWKKKVEDTRPNVETDATVVEIRELRDKINQLVELIGEQQKPDTGTAAAGEADSDIQASK